MKTEFNSAYLSSLTNGPGDFDPKYVDQLQDVMHAEVPGPLGNTIDFVRFSPKTQDSSDIRRPIIYVPGFTEGIIAKAPFGMAVAELGNDVIIPDQNRELSVKKDTAASTQAQNYLAIIENLGLQNTPLDVVAHSYGSMIFEEMAKEAAEKGWTCFSIANVAMIAPSGSYDQESLTKIGARQAHEIKQEMSSKTQKVMPDSTKLMEKAGMANLLANKRRSLAEALELASRVVEYDSDTAQVNLDLLVGKICIFGFSEDRLFGPEQLQDAAKRIMGIGGSYATPVRFIETVDTNGNKRATRDTTPQTHNDDQFNPRRVAAAVNEFFRRTVSETN